MFAFLKYEMNAFNVVSFYFPKIVIKFDSMRINGTRFIYIHMFDMVGSGNVKGWGVTFICLYIYDSQVLLNTSSEDAGSIPQPSSRQPSGSCYPGSLLKCI